MTAEFVDTSQLPFCKGCSHHLVVRNIQKALQKTGIDPLDVVLVTDIGCHGIIDKKFFTHTVHGLHGRSVALGAGISAALSDPKKKVIVFIGDGGSTIGLNHLIGAARRNFNMTVIVHNNMLYGMTGGQPSDLTPCNFKTRIQMNGYTDQFLDLTNVIKDAGASYVSRIVAKGDFTDRLGEALQVDGFSMVEFLEICSSYALKQNPGIGIRELAQKYNIPLQTYVNPNTQTIRLSPSDTPPSLFEALQPIPQTRKHTLKKGFSLIIGGSAGEGIQVAAEILAKAALSCGLNVTKKGVYPVTVGIGFSVAEMILSIGPIHFTDNQKIEGAIMTSQDGMDYFSQRIKKMNEGLVVTDSRLDCPNRRVRQVSGDFRQKGKEKQAMLYGMLAFLQQSGIFPTGAFIDAIRNHPVGRKIDMAEFQKEADTLLRMNVPVPAESNRVS